jgi:hypothetical protein
MRKDLGEMRHESVTQYNMVQCGVQWRLILTANILEVSVSTFVIVTV